MVLQLIFILAIQMGTQWSGINIYIYISLMTELEHILLCLWPCGYSLVNYLFKSQADTVWQYLLKLTAHIIWKFCTCFWVVFFLLRSWSYLYILHFIPFRFDWFAFFTLLMVLCFVFDKQVPKFSPVYQSCIINALWCLLLEIFVHPKSEVFYDFLET